MSYVLATTYHDTTFLLCRRGAGAQLPADAACFDDDLVMIRAAVRTAAPAQFAPVSRTALAARRDRANAQRRVPIMTLERFLTDGVPQFDVTHVPGMLPAIEALDLYAAEAATVCAIIRDAHRDSLNYRRRIACGAFIQAHHEGPHRAAPATRLHVEFWRADAAAIAAFVVHINDALRRPPPR